MFLLTAPDLRTKFPAPKFMGPILNALKNNKKTSRILYFRQNRKFFQCESLFAGKFHKDRIA